MGKYAILLSGGVSYGHNYIRYKNDLELAYKALKDAGNFSDENIYLFFADGHKQFENTQLTVCAAKKNKIQDCLKRMIHELSEEDELALIVSNHGGDEENGTICLWGSERIELCLLAEWLNHIKAKKIIILGQCFAGNILEYEISNACVFTANEQGALSYAHMTKTNRSCLYDEFIYHFFSYIIGCYPDTGSRIPQGSNDLMQAYQYAKDNDIFNPDNEQRLKIKIEGEWITEIPQVKNDLADNVLRL